MTKYLIGLLLLLIAGYGLIEAWPLISGPSMVIDSPQNGETVTGGTLTISGTVKHTTSLMLDGFPLIPTENGAFAATLTFPAGGSILTFVATDRFGHTVTRTREIYVP
jgi:hypothetical protein